MLYSIERAISIAKLLYRDRISRDDVTGDLANLPTFSVHSARVASLHTSFSIPSSRSLHMRL